MLTRTDIANQAQIDKDLVYPLFKTLGISPVKNAQDKRYNYYDEKTARKAIRAIRISKRIFLFLFKLTGGSHDSK